MTKKIHQKNKKKKKQKKKKKEAFFARIFPAVFFLKESSISSCLRQKKYTNTSQSFFGDSPKNHTFYPSKP
jgi:hypothetical protein